MNSIVLTSTNEILQFALEEIYINFKKNLFLDSYDFIVFAISPKYPYVDINKDIQKIFKTNNYIAFNTVTSIASQNTIDGISALFIKFEKDGEIELFTCECGENKEEKIKNYLLNHKNDLNILLTTYSPDISEFLEELNFNFPIPVCGGIVSGEEIHDEYVGNLYLKNKIIKKGMIILTIKNVEFDIQIATGYKPIGPSYKITLAKKHKVFVVEYEDATMICKKLLQGLDDFKNLWYSPILIEREFLIPRTFKSIKDNLYVEFYGEIKNNDNIYLSFANKEKLIEEDIKKATKLKKNLRNIDVVFDFSCVAREYVLEDMVNKELLEFSKITNAPVFGFFTFGEIYNLKNHITLFNQTSIIIGVRE